MSGSSLIKLRLARSQLRTMMVRKKSSFGKTVVRSPTLLWVPRKGRNKQRLMSKRGNMSGQQPAYSVLGQIIGADDDVGEILPDSSEMLLPDGMTTV